MIEFFVAYIAGIIGGIGLVNLRHWNIMRKVKRMERAQTKRWDAWQKRRGAAFQRTDLTDVIADDSDARYEHDQTC